MNLNLYDKQLNRIAIIGGRFISSLWSEGYNSIQPYSLELQATDEYKKKVKPDCYIGRDDRKTLMVLKTVQIKNGKIIASGKQATRCLNDVAFVGTIAAGSKVAQAIKEAYDGSEKYENLVFADSDLEVTYNHQISHKSFSELCETVCQSTDVGFRAVRSNGKVLIELYQPQENPNLVFSERFGNLTIESITLSTENFKNHAVVLGEGEDADRACIEVDLSGGEQKRSLIIDARDITREDGETDESYNTRLAIRGYEKLLEKTKTWECAFAPLAKDFGTRYDLGDILTVFLPDYDLKLKARVTRFTQKEQNNQTKTTIEVGNITITR